MEVAVSATKHDPRRRALGKGLESLLPARPAAVPELRAAAVEPEAPGSKVQEVELTLIERNPFQTRTVFDREKLSELAQSIAASGVVQPISLRPLPDGRFQLITGERRWLASFEAGKTHIPAIVREVSDEQAMEMTIVENLQRADLNPMEQARAYQRLSEEFKMSQTDMAVRTGLPRSAVANFIRLTKLPEAVQQKLESRELSFGHAKLLLSLDGLYEIEKAARRVIALSMSVRQTETYVHGLLFPESKKKPEKPVPDLDPNVRHIQEELQRALGLKVLVEDKKGKGRVIIEYSRLEDFDALLIGLRGK